MLILIVFVPHNGSSSTFLRPFQRFIDTKGCFAKSKRIIPFLRDSILFEVLLAFSLHHSY